MNALMEARYAQTTADMRALYEQRHAEALEGERRCIARLDWNRARQWQRIQHIYLQLMNEVSK